MPGKTIYLFQNNFQIASILLINERYNCTLNRSPVFSKIHLLSLCPGQSDLRYKKFVNAAITNYSHDRTFRIKCCRMKNTTELLELSVAGRKTRPDFWN
ncbi:hypothetical protein RCL_jg5963.t1 [Rhizophagus clarus]|uniref:Uncharacterized protein n=1 Tax=Rhizophagus clarus TaxID=94130 RepID=A0A8H3QWI9_9GLOM|nr:hypothetical protein RCL_jg5963.t1 [Rhizophagus clarus]